MSISLDALEIEHRDLLYDDDVPLGAEMRDEWERALGGKWRLSKRLLPGEDVVVDERLCDVI